MRSAGGWPWLLAVLFLCTCHVTAPLSGNEEDYFSLALQYVQPDWIPGGFTATEPPGTRLLFQLAVGNILRAASFENVAFAGRLACCLLAAWALVRVARTLELPVWCFLLVLAVFVSRQSFFGGEWMLGGLEPKTPAYVAVLFSIACLVRGRMGAAVVLAAGATWLHVLAGGWYSAALLLAFLLMRVPLRPWIGLVLIYGILAGPWLFHLASGIYLTMPPVEGGVTADWIYTYFRNPHHTVVWADAGTFVRSGLGKLLKSLAATAALLALWRTAPDRRRPVLALALAGWGVFWACVLAGAFDRQGVFLKFYPFRIQTVAWLLTLLLIAERVVVWAAPRIQDRPLAPLAAAAAVLVLGWARCQQPGWLFDRDTELETAAAFLEREVPLGGTVFVWDPDRAFGDWHGRDVRLMRLSRRDLFVSFKIVPAGGPKLAAWYERLLEKRRAECEPGRLPDLARRYGFRHVVALAPVKAPGLVPLGRHGGLNVYRVSGEPP